MLFLEDFRGFSAELAMLRNARQGLIPRINPGACTIKKFLVRRFLILKATPLMNQGNCEWMLAIARSQDWGWNHSGQNRFLAFASV